MSNFQQHPQPDPGFENPGIPEKQPTSRRRWLPWAAGAGTFLLGLVIGASGGSTAEAPVGVTSQAGQPTVTVTVPGPAGATVPGPTVTKPGPTVKVTVTAPPPQAAAAIEGDGTYEVGADIKPGKYKTSGGVDCYWARLKNLEGGLDSIIANNLGDGPQTVTVKKTDAAFETTRCNSWTKVG